MSKTARHVSNLSSDVPALPPPFDEDRDRPRPYRSTRPGAIRCSKRSTAGPPGASVLGFELQGGPFRYKSTYPPVPLAGLEEELLVGAWRRIHRARA
jgi:hypothetical protein